MLLNLLEIASNKTLQHDPQTRARLAKLQGKTMALKLKPIQQSISVTPHSEGLEFSAERLQNVDVTLTTTLGAMIKISRDGLENADLNPGELEIAGDPIVGQRFAQAIADLNVDWQGLLSEHLGESPARAVTMVASQAKTFASESSDKVKEMVKQLVTDELELVAQKPSVESFLDDVDTIRADADRLIARIKRLQTKI